MKRQVLLILFILIFAVALVNLPEFGRDLGGVSQYYLSNTLPDTGALSAVSAVVWSYRGYDTLGEVIVLLTAVTGILTLLREEI